MEPHHRCAPLPRGRYEPQAKLPYIVRLLRTVFVATYAYVNGVEARASLVLALASQRRFADLRQVRLPVLVCLAGWLNKPKHCYSWVVVREKYCSD